MKKRMGAVIALKCLVIGVVLTLGACAIGSDAPIHEFEFDTWVDSPDVEVLDYQYGTSRQPGVRPSAESLRLHQVGQASGVNGAMLRGEFLYVKWRIRKTGEVYEDRVDLRNRLPKDLDHCNIHFVIDGAQLNVYVISPEKVAGHCPQDKSAAYKRTRPQDRIFLDYCAYRITRIYPG